MEQRFKILIIDDDVGLASNLQDILEAEGYSTAVAHDGQTALTLCCEKAFDLAVVDIKLPDISGLELISKLADEVSNEAVYVIITGYASIENAIEAVKQENIISYETKPLDMTRFLALIRQVFERKQAEEALRQSEESYRTIFETTGTAMLIGEEDATISMINAEFEKLCGYSKGEVEGKKKWMEFIVKADLERLDESHRLRMTEPNVAQPHYGFQFIDKHGNVKDIIISLELIPGTKKTVGSLVDITERKQIEEALQESEERYRSLTNDVLDSSAVGIFILDSEFRVVWVNKSLERYFGLRRSEIVGKDKRQLIREGIKDIFDDPERFTKLVFATYDNNTYVENFECHVLSDGEREERWLEHWSQPIRAGLYTGGRIEHYYDITERKKTAEALQESEEKYSSIVEHARDGIAIVQDGVFKLTNAAFSALHGYERDELLGSYQLDLTMPISRDTVLSRYNARIAGSEVPTVYEVKALCKDGTTKDAELTATTMQYQGRPAVMAIVRDITERKKMEEQLLINDRLASLGELVSGIAHEMNNPLTSVIGFSDLLVGRKDLPDDVKDDIKLINKEAQRTSNIVRNLLTFARKHPKEKQATDINKVIQAVLELRAYEQKLDNIQVNTRFSLNLAEVMANAFELQQVFLNIIVNAEHAMLEAHQGGTLTITTERDGDIIRASLADDGPGITKENLPHLFDPFFTTKEVGKGTGLGLSICHGNIIEHDSRIYAESELGKGATFIIELPVATTDNEGTANENS